MGCWNETCLFTRLPILAGDRIAVMLLTERPGHTDACSSDGSYRPSSLPVLGEYDEYGSVENVEDETTVLKMLRGIAPFALSKIDGRPEPIPVDGRSVTEIISDLRQENCFTNISGNARPVRIFPVMILRKYYDMAQTGFAGYYGYDPEDETSAMYFRIHAASAHPGWIARQVENHSLAPETLKPLLALETFASRMRISWCPTTGSGSQSAIDSEAKLAFYESMAADARDMYRMIREDE